MAYRQNVAASGGGAGAMPGRQGKMGSVSIADLSEILEEFQSKTASLPALICRKLRQIQQLDERVDKARSEIREQSQKYVCAKDPKAGGKTVSFLWHLPYELTIAMTLENFWQPQVCKSRAT
jgi:hypothetical protein